MADICLIVEGAYPYVSGGVSAWVHGVIRRQPDLRFCVVAILPAPPPPPLKYDRLPNLDALHHLYLSETYSRRGRRGYSSFDEAAFDRAVDAFLSGGGLAELASVDRLIGPLVTARRTGDLLDSTLAWNLVCDLYTREMPHESFLHFFWAWRALFGGLVATLSFPLPPAHVYHTVSTGYAGLLAARAAIETGAGLRFSRQTGSSTRSTRDLPFMTLAAICAIFGRPHSRAMPRRAMKRARR
ncbi:MAG: DUF3492 domain-containing protein [Alphaproteobacteria bacterium]|nr:MAG: DUF3492 domain-containing protein [Alphaproteobacteria bacterium]